MTWAMNPVAPIGRAPLVIPMAARLADYLRRGATTEEWLNLFASDICLARFLCELTEMGADHFSALEERFKALEPESLHARALELLVRTPVADDPAQLEARRDALARAIFAERLASAFENLAPPEARWIGLLLSTIHPSTTEFHRPSDGLAEDVSALPTRARERWLCLVKSWRDIKTEEEESFHAWTRLAPATLRRWERDALKEAAAWFDDALSADEWDRSIRDLVFESYLAETVKVEKLRRDRDALHEQVRRDPLLGIGNRRHFDDRLAQEWKRAQRNGQPLSLILFDIDHFKRLNDTYRHQAGDQVLRVATEVIRGCLRLSDSFSRYGGEEFAVICPETDVHGAAALAERMRKALEETSVIHRGQTLSTTASFGAVTAVDTTLVESAEELIDAADLLLYEAKHAGRNCVRQGICPASLSPGSNISLPTVENRLFGGNF